jgi:hypothetical protein
MRDGDEEKSVGEMTKMGSKDKEMRYAYNGHIQVWER